MLEMCYRPLERCFGGEADGDGLMWHVGMKPHSSGDFSMAVVQANSVLEDQGQVLTTPSATYVGVYDGHGGPEASRFITHSLFSFIHEFASEQGGLSADVIRKAYSATEEEFLDLARQSFPEKPQLASVGSCCLVGVISNGTLYVANLGDSRAVLGRRVFGDHTHMNGRVVAERLSTEHNVCFEEVRKEVEALHPDDPEIVVCTKGVWRIRGIIQVSRSIGDFYLKKPEFHQTPFLQQLGSFAPPKKPLVTAEPSVLIRELKPQDLFMIFASDGLWEHLTDEAAVDTILKYPRTGIARRLVRAALQEAGRKREIGYEDIRKIKKGTRRHFHDDITVIVVFLDGTGKGSRAKHQDHFNRTSAPVDIYSHNAQGKNVSPTLYCVS